MKRMLMAAVVLVAGAASQVSVARDKGPDPDYMMPIAADLPVEIQQVPAGWFIGADYEEPDKQPWPPQLARLKALIGSYPFNAKVEAALRAKLPNSGLATTPSFHSGSWPELEASMRERLPRAMQITPEWELSDGNARLNVGLHTVLAERRLHKRGKLDNKNYFEGDYFFYLVLPVKGSPDENLKAWESMGSERLSALLDEATGQTVDMLVYNFSEEGRAAWAKAPNLGPAVLEGRRFGGNTLKKGDDWVWVPRGEVEEQAIEGYRLVKPGA